MVLNGESWRLSSSDTHIFLSRFGILNRRGTSKKAMLDKIKRENMGLKSKNHWYNAMMQRETPAMEKQTETENKSVEKKSKKSPKNSSVRVPVEKPEMKTLVKVTFEGEAAQKILKCESELKDRLSKPDLGKILGAEICTWSEKRWSEIVEENTDMDYFFAQIRKCTDKSKSIKLLKALTEKLRSEGADSAQALGATTPSGLTTESAQELQSDAVV